MNDFFPELLDPQPAPAFRDIRNTRPSAAEEKAVLVLQLGKLINSVPTSVRNGSINHTRNWQAARTACAKVAKNSRASVNELTSAINRMAQYE